MKNPRTISKSTAVRPYIKGVSELLHRYLQQQGARTVFKSDTTLRVKEAIHSRLHPNFINRDNGIVTPKAWMPTIKKHNSGSITKRTSEGTTL
ncbi:hypothetical protein pdam_00004342 [Pocillopora damicornis]|uniref:Uncharacterized protein n=1 Tax=Pocillopora damicornis TaxID=46731 RepID=A0A3M6UJA2_POCDA|nr:hypothetical protein pdam_00004342 [Pocillopora damicornis]